MKQQVNPLHADVVLISLTLNELRTQLIDWHYVFGVRNLLFYSYHDATYWRNIFVYMYAMHFNANKYE